jgi:hypothetical protein
MGSESRSSHPLQIGVNEWFLSVEEQAHQASGLSVITNFRRHKPSRTQKSNAVKLARGAERGRRRVPAQFIFKFDPGSALSLHSAKFCFKMYSVFKFVVEHGPQKRHEESTSGRRRVPCLQDYSRVLRCGEGKNWERFSAYCCFHKTWSQSHSRNAIKI